MAYLTPNYKNILIVNLEQLHTTAMGEIRIRMNLGLDECDVVEFCKSMIQREDCIVNRVGKNYYCKSGKMQLTVNANSYTIITAHII